MSIFLLALILFKLTIFVNEPRWNSLTKHTKKLVAFWNRSWCEEIQAI